MKKIALFLTIMLTCFTGCSKDESVSSTTSYQTPVLEDSDFYRNYYQIFPYSFYDTNNDKIGDLNGISEKLDYIEDLGFNGIYLNPINKAYSYHKYDVIDYLSIDSDFGSMDDFKNLLLKAKEKNIKVVMDLVLNHTSINHPWFKKAIEDFKKGEGEYSDFYNLSSYKHNEYIYNYDGVYYEANFTSSMPELNLDSQKVRKEIENIVKFYIDLGIGGFRLDATTYFYFKNVTKNTEFLKYFTSYVKSLNKSCFIVGEAWTSQGEIKSMYESGIDSFFTYYNNRAYGYSLLTDIVTNDPASYVNRSSFFNNMRENSVPSFFITNHDNPRSANILQSRYDQDKLKFGYGLMGMTSGAIFNYYGDEISMLGSNPPDQNVRTHMYFNNDKSNMPNNPEGTTNFEDKVISVEDAYKDPSSTLYYIQNINRLRLEKEAIRKGSVDLIENNSSLALIKKEYKDQIIHLLINFSEETKTYDLSKLSYKNITCFNIDNNNSININNKEINIPKYGIVVLD